jgi:hypothetical protein
MTSLRDQIANLIDNELSGFGSYNVALGLADSILVMTAASAMSGSAQDHEDGLGPKGASAVPKADAPEQSA